MKTKRTQQLPPFYTHVIGSLPRPKALQHLVARRAEVAPAEYEKLLDEMVIFAIRLQELAGLDVVSDGEWRRTHYIGEFLERVGGFEKCRKYEHQGETKYTSVVVRKMKAAEPVFTRDAGFLAKNATKLTKFALPSPFLIAVRYWHADYSKEAYPTYQHFMDHLAEMLAREAKAIAVEGVDVIQIDDPALTYFCDRQLMEGGSSHDERLRREWNVETQFPLAISAINRIAEGLPAEVHVHCCHSVYKRQSDVKGDYKPILPRLKDARIDQINLEFAYKGTGDTSDLALLPPHLNVGMGVVDVRSETLQSVEQIESIAAAGAQVVGKKRVAMNPDCGFAPDAGEPPTIDEAFEKLRRMCEAAQRLRQRA
ncbi:MAG TPA: cobalamin-independent methionine synthase II family protein [Planctomycetota bacterium]|nr:cobalamin-independent methionine synthase II family protein [Planctomycetota bacterium]